MDESGCCPESPLSYGYGQIGQQKSIPQRTRKGRRVNIMGVWEEETRLEYALKIGTNKTKSYLHFMNWQAERAMNRLFDTGKPTVIIYDLAKAIIEGFENRAQLGNYPVERLMFN